MPSSKKSPESRFLSVGDVLIFNALVESSAGVGFLTLSPFVPLVAKLAIDIFGGTMGIPALALGVICALSAYLHHKGIGGSASAFPTLAGMFVYHLVLSLQSLAYQAGFRPNPLLYTPPLFIFAAHSLFAAVTWVGLSRAYSDMRSAMLLRR